MNVDIIWSTTLQEQYIFDMIKYHAKVASQTWGQCGKNMWWQRWTTILVMVTDSSIVCIWYSLYCLYLFGNFVCTLEGSCAWVKHFKISISHLNHQEWLHIASPKSVVPCLMCHPWITAHLWLQWILPRMTCRSSLDGMVPGSSLPRDYKVR